MIPVKPSPKIEYDFSDNIFVRESYLDKEVCDNLIEECKNLVQKGKPHNWSGSWSKHFLDCNHIIHQHINSAWLEAIDFYGTSVDFIEQYHVKKYTFGNFYGIHTDNFISVAKRIDRKLTLVVQLSDDCDYKSGDLYVEGNIMTRKKGSVIIFPSAYKHKVSNLGFGERWVLISWGWGPVLK
jgi:hypothetical protein